MAEEKLFEQKVHRFLQDYKCWNVKYFANGYTRSGIPDLLVCCEGKFIGVELKVPNGRPSALQLRQLDLIESAGGLAVLLYPEDFSLFQMLIIGLKMGNFDVEAYEELKKRREHASQSFKD